MSSDRLAARLRLSGSAIKRSCRRKGASDVRALWPVPIYQPNSMNQMAWLPPEPHPLVSYSRADHHQRGRKGVGGGVVDKTEEQPRALWRATHAPGRKALA